MKLKKKTKKALVKRFKISGSGKILFYPTKRRHLLTGKPARKMLQLRRAEVAGPVESKRVKSLMAAG